MPIQMVKRYTGKLTCSVYNGSGFCLNEAKVIIETHDQLVICNEHAEKLAEQLVKVTSKSVTNLSTNE